MSSFTQLQFFIDAMGGDLNYQNLIINILRKCSIGVIITTSQFWIKNFVLKKKCLEWFEKELIIKLNTQESYDLAELIATQMICYFDIDTQVPPSYVKFCNCHLGTNWKCCNLDDINTPKLKNNKLVGKSAVSNINE